jgi:hypothetical protein
MTHKLGKPDSVICAVFSKADHWFSSHRRSFPSLR